MQLLQKTCVVLLLLASVQAAAQPKFLKKVSNAANSVLNTVNNGNNSGTQQTGSTTGSNTSSGTSTQGSNRPVNRGGQGLIATPPDVASNLSSSEAAFKNKNYGEARFALQQAMLGVELEIGQSILKSMPEEIAGLPKQTAQDQVASTGWGWAGLTIKRAYQKDDKAITITIASNAIWMQAVNMYLSSGMYNQSTGGQQNWKQTKLKNNRGVIEYEDHSGYKLSVPLGQTTLLMAEGVNFANEQEFMKAAETLDIDKIKSLLSEK